MSVLCSRCCIYDFGGGDIFYLLQGPQGENGTKGDTGMKGAEGPEVREIYWHNIHSIIV